MLPGVDPADGGAGEASVCLYEKGSVLSPIPCLLLNDSFPSYGDREGVHARPAVGLRGQSGGNGGEALKIQAKVTDVCMLQKQEYLLEDVLMGLSRLPLTYRSRTL